MKVKFKRTGGFANIPVNVEVDVNNAAVNVANELKELVGKVTFVQEGAAPGADVCSYELHVQDGDQEKVLTTNDMTVTDEASNLFEFLMRNFWG